MSFITDQVVNLYSEKTDGAVAPAGKFYAADANQTRQALLDVRNQFVSGAELPLIALSGAVVCGTLDLVFGPDTSMSLGMFDISHISPYSKAIRSDTLTFDTVFGLYISAERQSGNWGVDGHLIHFFPSGSMSTGTIEDYTSGGLAGPQPDIISLDFHTLSDVGDPTINSYPLIGARNFNNVSSSIVITPDHDSFSTYMEMSPGLTNVVSSVVSLTGSVKITQLLNLKNYENVSPSNGDVWMSGTSLLVRITGSNYRINLTPFP